MLERLARLAVSRPTAVLAATLVLMVAAFVYGSGISERLSVAIIALLLNRSALLPWQSSVFTPARPT